MVPLKVRIQSKEDARKGIPALEGVDPKELVEVRLETVAILEGGMASGKTSLMFHIKLPDGKDAYAQLSANHLDAVYHALQGAEIRFAEAKTKKQ